MKTDNRLPLLQAIRVYWPNVLPVPFLVPMTVFTVGLMPRTLGLLVATLEIVAISLVNFWPMMLGRVQKSYFHLSTCLYFAGVLLIYPIVGLLSWLLPHYFD